MLPHNAILLLKRKNTIDFCLKMKYTLSILLFCFTSILLHAQTDTIATAKLFSFVKNASTFNRLNPQEKVYLHFDNMGYYLGETIWFKAYVVNASWLQSTKISKVLYVELLTREGECIRTLTQDREWAVSR